MATAVSSQSRERKKRKKSCKEISHGVGPNAPGCGTPVRGVAGWERWTVRYRDVSATAGFRTSMLALFVGVAISSHFPPAGDPHSRPHRTHVTVTPRRPFARRLLSPRPLPPLVSRCRLPPLRHLRFSLSTNVLLTFAFDAHVRVECWLEIEMYSRFN